MIAAKPSTIPYLSALLPSELELQTLEETDSSEQDDQTDTENPSNISQASMKQFFSYAKTYLQFFFWDIFLFVVYVCVYIAICMCVCSNYILFNYFINDF